ncbi:hypothetical protein STEG23_014655, partial [Scotinomys teguina]
MGRKGGIFLLSGSLILTESELDKIWNFQVFISNADVSLSSCFSLSLSIPILDCHHTWCCCGTPSDFYCATQT